MTRAVVTVGPGTPVRYAAELMAGRGFAALPVVDGEGALVGVVAEADVLRHRVPQDPRLHLRRDASPTAVPPPRVGEVMTTAVRTVEAGTDVADVARLLLDERLRSLPVVEDGRPAGIVSRRDLLAALVRPDDLLRDELLGLVERWTGEPGAVDVRVREGVATVRRVYGAPDPSAEVERRAFEQLGRTVGGIVAVRTPVPDRPAPSGSPA